MNNYKVDLRKPITTGKVVNPHLNSTSRSKNDKSFDAILKQTLKDQEPIKFSKHAQERMHTRGIKLSERDIKKINMAVDLARERAIEDSLVILGDLALIINVPSRTVITAMDGQNMKQNVFTNIDGAVIV